MVGKTIHLKPPLEIVLPPYKRTGENAVRVHDDAPLQHVTDNEQIPQRLPRKGCVRIIEIDTMPIEDIPQRRKP